MPRTKTGTNRRKRHKKILKKAKGFRGTNNRLFKRAHEAVLHSMHYAFVGRKLRKRDMRKLWIQRIGAGVKQATDGSLNYSRFIYHLKKNNVDLNRKVLAHLAATDFGAFQQIVDSVSPKK